MAITINDKTYRNLQDQVEFLTEKVEAHYQKDQVLTDYGITVLGRINTINDRPDQDYEYGDAFLVGTEPPYDTYIYTRNDATGIPGFLNIGPLSIVGPEGPAGVSITDVAGWGEPSYSEVDGYTKTTDQIKFTFSDGSSKIYSFSARAKNGEKGEKGDQGERIQQFSLISRDVTNANDITTTTNTYNILYPDGSAAAFPVRIITQAYDGKTGPKGDKGDKGDTGDVGGFINIAGIISSVDDLPSPSVIKDLTRAFLVGTAEPYDLYIQVGSTSDVATWTNMGVLNVATYVTVNGKFQNTWDADTKKDNFNFSNTGDIEFSTLSNGDVKADFTVKNDSVSTVNLAAVSSAGKVVKSPITYDDATKDVKFNTQTALKNISAIKLSNFTTASDSYNIVKYTSSSKALEWGNDDSKNIFHGKDFDIQTSNKPTYNGKAIALLEDIPDVPTVNVKEQMADIISKSGNDISINTADSTGFTQVNGPKLLLKGNLLVGSNSQNFIRDDSNNIQVGDSSQTTKLTLNGDNVQLANNYLTSADGNNLIRKVDSDITVGDGSGKLTLNGNVILNSNHLYNSTGVNSIIDSSGTELIFGSTPVNTRIKGNVVHIDGPNYDDVAIFGSATSVLRPSDALNIITNKINLQGNPVLYNGLYYNKSGSSTPDDIIIKEDDSFVFGNSNVDTRIQGGTNIEVSADNIKLISSEQPIWNDPDNVNHTIAMKDDIPAEKHLYDNQVSIHDGDLFVDYYIHIYSSTDLSTYASDTLANQLAAIFDNVPNGSNLNVVVTAPSSNALIGTNCYKPSNTRMYFYYYEIPSSGSFTSHSLNINPSNPGNLELTFVTRQIF